MPNLKSVTKYIVVGWLCILFAIACKKKKSESSIPVLTTVGVTDITDTSVRAGGLINSNGGEEIITSGFCWSKTNSEPTIADDTTVTKATSGGFISALTNLEPVSTYYIRGYAINGIGTGYGNVITFNTAIKGNSVPAVTNIIITGSPVVDSVLAASYTYSDIENDPDSGSVYQWYSAVDTAGGIEVAISGANDTLYTVSIADTATFLRIGIVPKASTGASPGVQVKSFWVGPVSE
jgi:hypothetical protein